MRKGSTGRGTLDDGMDRHETGMPIRVTDEDGACICVQRAFEFSSLVRCADDVARTQFFAERFDKVRRCRHAHELCTANRQAAIHFPKYRWSQRSDSARVLSVILVFGALSLRDGRSIEGDII